MPTGLGIGVALPFGSAQSGGGSGSSSLLAGLQAYYKFNEAAGTNAASEVSGLDLTLSGTPTPTWVSGLIGNCIDFAGASASEVASRSGVSGTGLDFTPGSWTISLWFKVNTFVAGRQIVARDTGGAGGRQFSIQTSGTNTMNCRVFDGTNQVGVLNLNYTNGAWQMITIGVDSTVGSFGQMFGAINAGARSTNNLTAAIGTVTTAFTVGRGSSASSLDSNVDMLGKWGRVLSTTEETALYAGGSGLQHPFS